MIVAFALIPSTWVMALALVRPVSDRTTGIWPLPFLLTLGCSGSVAAVLIA